MTTRCFKLTRRDHMYLTFLVEAHEGLCTVSTVDQRNGIVRISAPPGREQEVADFITALKRELDLQEVPCPCC